MINHFESLQKFSKYLYFGKLRKKIKKDFGKDKNFMDNFWNQQTTTSKRMFKKIQIKTWDAFKNSDGVFIVVKNEWENEISDIIRKIWNYLLREISI